MIEWTVSLGAILTGLLVVIGFVATSLLNAFAIGKYSGAIEGRLTMLDRRMEELEKSETKIADALIQVAQQQVRLDNLNARVDEVQRYGSHRLAEVLEAMRGQIMSDFRERFEFLQKQIAAKGEL
jgi:hypothetical protein